MITFVGYTGYRSTRGNSFSAIFKMIANFLGLKAAGASRFDIPHINVRNSPQFIRATQ